MNSVNSHNIVSAFTNITSAPMTYLTGSGLDLNIQSGWVCPKCGRVYAPWMAMCSTCGGIRDLTWTSNTTNGPVQSEDEPPKDE